jgi:catechol 2,3-dioxygenase-like lactoylglutathione lyase family enzyme
MDAQRATLANVITLGARDLPLLRDCYRRLGWPRVIDDEDFAAFELRGAVLALFPVDKLAADGRGEPESGRGGIRFTIGAIVDSAQAVDELTELMRQAGGRVTKEPVAAEFFEGRSAYIADPEGNYWEIAWAGADNAVVAAARRSAGMTGPAESPESSK